MISCKTFSSHTFISFQGGGYMMYWFDTYSAGISLLCAALFEAIGVAWIYGKIFYQFHCLLQCIKPNAILQYRLKLVQCLWTKD